MQGFNKFIGMGNLTRDPELHFTASGTPIAEFGLAMNRRFKQGDDLKEEVCFIDVTVFGKQAEHCTQYLQKGRSALVEGRLRLDQYQTKGGEKRSKLGVIAESVTFIGGKEGE